MGFLVGQHALLFGLGDPVIVMITPHLVLADGALEFLIGLLAGNSPEQRVFEQAQAVGGIVRDEDVSGETVAELAGLKRRTHDLFASIITRRAPRT